MAVQLAGNLVLRDGNILLLYREDEGHWEVPGGKVEDDESPTEAAVREAREEAGIDVELETPLFSGEFVHKDELYLWHCYIAKTEDEPELKEGRFSELRWVEPGELDDLELAPNLRQILPALRKIGNV